MSTKEQYYALLAEIDAIAEKHGCKYDLTNSCVDAENCLPLSWDDGEEFWIGMYASLCNSAGSRAEEKGINLNKELGRIIY
jgi:hypothetical protein